MYKAKGLSVEIRKVIHIPEWNEEIRQQIIAFWQERHIVFTETQGDFLKGKRGSLWGNLTSFDMGKLIATLTISRTNPQEIVCILNVNTVMQIVTEWNKAYWQLEMDMLESWLLHHDKKEAVWEAFLEGARKAAATWTVSGGRRGNKMPPKV